ncbi:MAG: GPW/gp25 family protein [Culicoidibacterales bacterium]
MKVLSVEGKDFYSDIPADFKKDFKDNDVGVVKNLSAIQQSLSGIISTRKGERPFDPDFGCDIYSSLFELMNDLATITIERSIMDAIKNYEPRVRMQGIQVVPVYDNNAYIVTIVYSMITDLDSYYRLKLELKDG